MVLRRLLVAAAVLVALAPPAGAHTSLASATPGPDETVDVAPSEVVLRFDDEVVPAVDGITVVGSDGERADTGEVSRPDPTTIVLGLRPGLPPGPYAVEWRILAQDGDVQEGGHTFTVVGEAPATTSTTATTLPPPTTMSVPVSEPPPADESVDGGSALLLIAGMALAVAVIVGVIVRRRREAP